MGIYCRTATGKTLQLIDPGSRIQDLIFSQDNKTLVGSTGKAWQSTYSFWNIEKGTRTNVLYNTGCLAFTERDAFVVSLKNQDDNDIGELVMSEDTFDKREFTIRLKLVGDARLSSLIPQTW